MTTHVTVVGGGLAGLTAAIACAEKGARVTLHEAHRTLGGRARSTEAPYVANDGTHAFYSDGEPFRWLAQRRLVQPFSRPTLRELRLARFRQGDRLRAVPPAGGIRMISRRGLAAPGGEPLGTRAGRRGRGGGGPRRGGAGGRRAAPAGARSR